MESQFDLLQSQVVALAADLKCVNGRLDKLDKPAAPLSAVVGDPKWDAPVEEPSPGRWEQVVGTIWDFYKPGAYLDHLRVYESTPDDRAKILATFDPDFVSISKAEYLALKRLEAWVEAFKTNRGIFSPTQDKLLDAILREITDTREGKSNG